MTENADNVTSRQFLVLNIGKHYFAANVGNIEDIIKVRHTTPVPLSKSNINGLLNLRGHIVTEVDVALTLGIPDDNRTNKGGFAVVINIKDELYSLAFDGVGDVITIEPDQIDPLPETVQKSWHQVSRGVRQLDRQLLVLLDLATMIGMLSDELNHDEVA